MSARTAEVVICGAGIAGIAAAYHLAVRRGVHGVVLVDERPPLSLTSDEGVQLGEGEFGALHIPRDIRPCMPPY